MAHGRPKVWDDDETAFDSNPTSGTRRDHATPASGHADRADAAVERAGDPADASEGIPTTKMPCFQSLSQLATISAFCLQSTLAEHWRMHDPATANHIVDARSGPR